MRVAKLARNVVLGVLGLGSASLWATAAQAEEIFPPVIAEAANMPCVPTCTLCHTTNPGNASSWPGKPFGQYMGLHGAKMGDANSIKTAFEAYKAADLASPGMGAGIKRLQAGLDPDTGAGLCGPTYGCGAHVAKQAPRSDLSAPLWVVGAIALGGLLRRRKSSAL